MKPLSRSLRLRLLPCLALFPLSLLAACDGHDTYSLVEPYCAVGGEKVLATDKPMMKIAVLSRLVDPQGKPVAKAKVLYSMVADRGEGYAPHALFVEMLETDEHGYLTYTAQEPKRITVRGESHSETSGSGGAVGAVLGPIFGGYASGSQQTTSGFSIWVEESQEPLVIPAYAYHGELTVLTAAGGLTIPKARLLSSEPRDRILHEHDRCVSVSDSPGGCVDRGDHPIRTVDDIKSIEGVPYDLEGAMSGISFERSLELLQQATCDSNWVRDITEVFVLDPQG